jgi:hypothetical protein
LIDLRARGARVSYIKGMSDDAQRRGEAKPASHDSSVAASGASAGGAGASGASAAESTGAPTVGASDASGAPLQSVQVTPVRASAPPAAAKKPSKDVVLLGPPTADGAGLHVLRARDERLEAGELRAFEEGKPIVGEIVTLRPREDNARVCDVTDSYAPPPPATAAHADAQLGHKGPAKVASPAYREGWDEIFGAKKKTPPPSSLN